MNRVPDGPPLVVDLGATQSPEHARRGIGRYVVELARSLVAATPERVRALLLDPSLPFPDALPLDLVSHPRLGWNTAAAWRDVEAGTWYVVGSPFELGRSVEQIVPPPVTLAGARILAVVYDLIPLREPARYLGNPSTAHRYRARCGLLRRADLLWTISGHTRREVVELLGVDATRVRAVGTGVSAHFAPAPSGGRGDGGRSFVLAVGGEDDRKNLAGLLAAWALLPARVRRGRRLTVAGALSEGYVEAVLARAGHEGARPEGFELLGPVGDDELRAAYRSCEVFVMPSSREGFGLPAAEALACGAPVLTSDTTALPEVLDWAEATFPPHDPAAMARAIERALTDGSFRAELRRRGAARVPHLRWGAVARRALATLPGADRARCRPRTRPHRRPHVAIVAATEGGAGAGDTDELLTALGPGVSVVVFDDGQAARHRSNGVERLPRRAFGTVRAPSAFDAIVYRLTGTARDAALLELLSKHPGIAHLRRPALGVGYAEAASNSPDPERSMRELLEDQYGTALRPALRAQPLEPTVIESEGATLTRDVARQAVAVVVQSDADAERVRVDWPAGARTAPLLVCPADGDVAEVIRRLASGARATIRPWVPPAAPVGSSR